MKAFKALANRASYGLKRMFRQTNLTTATQHAPTTTTVNPYIEQHSKHRNIMPIYDLSPAISLHSYVAPNATVVGEVTIGSQSLIWYGVIIRGDMNEVKIGNSCSIGENTVIHTAGALPTGLPATVEIGNLVNIANNCTLYSCYIEDSCYVGFKSIILEGARLEKGCAIGPNSVVPPGRIIPSGQLWAGNPVEYVRDLQKSEIQSNTHFVRQMASIALDHEYEFLPYNSAYLQKENSYKDVNISPEEYKDKSVTQEDME